MTAAQCSRQPCGHYTQVFITSSFVSSNFSTHENIYGCSISENFLIKCRKTKTSVMTMTNHSIGKVKSSQRELKVKRRKLPKSDWLKKARVFLDQSWDEVKQKNKQTNNPGLPPILNWEVIENFLHIKAVRSKMIFRLFKETSSNLWKKQSRCTASCIISAFNPSPFLLSTPIFDSTEKTLWSTWLIPTKLTVSAKGWFWCDSSIMLFERSFLAICYA